MTQETSSRLWRATKWATVMLGLSATTVGAERGAMFGGARRLLTEGLATGADLYAGPSRQRHARSLMPWVQESARGGVPTPRVALLFLTRGDMPQAATWAAWLGSAVGLAPAKPCWGADACAAAAAAWLAEAESLAFRPEAAGAAQQLFSLYVHAPPNAPGLASDPTFGPWRIPQQVPTQWGDHSLIDATRALLLAALGRPENVRFALLSGDSVPLYPPVLTYAQLLAESTSRLRACAQAGNHQPDRWHPKMERGPHPITRSHWRKGSQWALLTRPHAELVVADVSVDALFRAHCVTTSYDPDLGRAFGCISDEHYVPTLLAVMGRENETDCLGASMHTDWRDGGAHPRSYALNDVEPQLFTAMRAPRGAVQEAQKRALRGMWHLHASLIHNAQSGRHPFTLANAPTLLPSLWARKFGPGTGDRVAAILQGLWAQDGGLDQAGPSVPYKRGSSFRMNMTGPLT